jgi:AcrR family transcriptional regulator
MPTGALRERRRLETKGEIGAAARALFLEVGYDATTVAAIAASAGVSERTFFRYFPTKEHVALEHLAAFVTHGVSLIEARPEHEHPRASILAAIDELAQHGYDESLALDALLVDTVAGVAGLQHHLVMAAQDRLTEVFRRRLALDRTALEPRLWAVICTASYQAATRTWVASLEAGVTDRDVWSFARETVERLGSPLLEGASP